ncbi:NAD(P)-binding protein [Bradyrhizobium sp. INPA01-394B]|uniref:FAD/NAD(P)-binding protein n=1 Tax=Bradyrhizobium campsiandrae TaxID=1729892 RepID=A0ABR7U749_9BRAD|nr:FAD/NAD(P)-binding protein [Bradyrhizobium campsiandrae]MBC9876597.1 NAD(P)-binding protein [Bradyrhizobium campsiandrae]MBC9979853.1 FAD/NAD(P)-binding protein [Bradyrhizobium campsiandrae]
MGPEGRHAIVIGGGASGVLLAFQLLKTNPSDLRVTLIEKRPEVGRGLAYHAGNPEHLLNVRVTNMSALPEDPDHFWNWLCARPGGPLCPDPYCFVPRQTYGDYLAELIAPLKSRDGSQGLTIVRGECVSIRENPSDVAVTLSDGTCITGSTAILATGHDAAVPLLAGHAEPWASPADAGIETKATVLILGTGLSMVDYVLSLLRCGHQGRIVALSRRGLLPRAHRRVDPMRFAESEIPFGAEIGTLLRWFRRRIERHVAEGGDWRGAIDAIRPFTQRLWYELPMSSRRRFLEHARAWWDVHRHRTAPEVEARIAEALAMGRLTVIAGKLAAVTPNAGGALVRYRRRGQAETSELQVGAIIDCTGIVRDPRASTNPAVRSLLDEGLARIDPLRIGIDVTRDCAIVNRDGSPSRRLYAVGPLTRAAFWEIIAVPDIRQQCAELAARLRAFDGIS